MVIDTWDSSGQRPLAERLEKADSLPGISTWDSRVSVQTILLAIQNFWIRSINIPWSPGPGYLSMNAYQVLLGIAY